MGTPRFSRGLVGALAVVQLAGCYLGSAQTVRIAEVEREPGWTVSRGVRLIRQQGRYDCGAAALAMVLARWDGRSTIEEVREDLALVYPTGAREGHAAAALRAVARRRGLEAFLVEGSFIDLERELGEGRPVLVGLVKSYRDGPRDHYEVVVGLNRQRRQILTADPDRGWRRNTLEGFLSEWQPAGRLTLVTMNVTPQEHAALAKLPTCN